MVKSGKGLKGFIGSLYTVIDGFYCLKLLFFACPQQPAPAVAQKPAGEVAAPAAKAGQAAGSAGTAVKAEPAAKAAAPTL